MVEILVPNRFKIEEETHFGNKTGKFSTAKGKVKNFCLSFGKDKLDIKSLSRNP